MNRSIVGLLTAGAALCSAPAAHAQALTVYSSLPLHGPLRPTTMAIARGAALALREAGGTAGGRPVRYVSLDAPTRRAPAWAPLHVAANARRVAEDPAAIGYIGDFNSGASAISIPILNEV